MQDQSSDPKSEQNLAAAAEPQTSQVYSTRRRSTRLQVAIPIILHWQDESGIAHVEKAFTLMVSRHGAEIAAPSKVDVGAEVEVENQGLKRSAKCRVVWARDRRSPNSPFEAGVALLGTENVWGVKFPPQDWEIAENSENGETEPRSSQQSSDETAKSPGLSTADSLSSEQSIVVSQDNSGFASEASEYDEDESAESGMVFEMTRFATHRLRQAQDEAAAEAAEAALRDRLERGAEEIGQLVAEARERAQQYWDERKKEADLLVAQSVNSAASVLRQAADDSAQALQDQVANLRTEYAKLAEDAAHARAEVSSSLNEELRNKDDVMRATEELGKVRAEVKSLLSNREQDKNELGKAFEETANARNEAAALLKKSQGSRDELKQAADDAAKARAEAAALLEEGKRGREDFLKLQEELRQSLSASHASAVGELTHQLAGVRAEMADITEHSLSALRRQGDDAMVRVNAETNKVKDDLEHLAADYRTSLSESSATLQDGFRHYLDLQVDVWKNETNATVKEIKESTLAELKQGLQGAADATLESAGAHLQRQVEDTRDLLGKELADTRQAAVEEARRQFAAESRQMKEDSEAFSIELRNMARTAREETEAHLRAVSQQAVDAIRAENSRLGDDWRESAKGIFHEAAEKELQSFQTRLHETLDAMRSPVLEQIEKQAQELKERAVKDAADAIHQQIGLGAVVLKEWADQATSRLEAGFQRQMADFEKRLVEGSQAMIERNHQAAEADVEALRRRLLEAAHLLERPGE